MPTAQQKIAYTKAVLTLERDAKGIPPANLRPAIESLRSGLRSSGGWDDSSYWLFSYGSPEQDDYFSSKILLDKLNTLQLDLIQRDRPGAINPAARTTQSPLAAGAKEYAKVVYQDTGNMITNAAKAAQKGQQAINTVLTKTGDTALTVANWSQTIGSLLGLGVLVFVGWKLWTLVPDDAVSRYLPKHEGEFEPVENPKRRRRRRR